jgi:hypothetical protein
LSCTQQESYTYGNNGSFKSENTLVGIENEGTVIYSNEPDKLQKLYEFAAKSDVEFAKIDTKMGSIDLSVLTTSHDQAKTTTVVPLIRILSAFGFEGVKMSHSHPPIYSDPRVPSGHYGVRKNNPWSLAPDKTGGKLKGDANNAVGIRKINRFDKMKFEVYSPSDNTTTIYDGVGKAVIHEKK